MGKEPVRVSDANEFTSLNAVFTHTAPRSILKSKVGHAIVLHLVFRFHRVEI